MNRLDDSARTHTQSSTDDVHSVCSQLSGVRFQDLAPPRVFPKAHQSSILRKYEEPALLVANPVRYSTIRFENTHSVVDFAQFGELPTFRKQACRSTNNPWRRYGALIKLTNTGGFAPNIGSKKDRKKREQLVYVKQNMKLPSPPQCSQMSLNKAREPGF
uniref:Uncharacterized protein n=1 Tax=Caenorhabditis japonica TaxID=281687 RepID=A0A8R1HJK6_CAEJA